ncbi:MAG: hypothetical protein AUJ98_04425 [Bacteroidetes bacterium CG2_30_33_31]|nr:MAG: hypothetical protein AUJ98_04425 [Bacteroidetes bacterium CG2_30_33_31]
MVQGYKFLYSYFVCFKKLKFSYHINRIKLLGFKDIIYCLIENFFYHFLIILLKLFFVELIILKNFSKKIIFIKIILYSFFLTKYFEINIFFSRSL